MGFAHCGRAGAAPAGRHWPCTRLRRARRSAVVVAVRATVRVGRQTTPTEQPTRLGLNEARHPSRPRPGQIRCRLRLVSGELVLWEAEHAGRQASSPDRQCSFATAASPWLHKSSRSALSRFPSGFRESTTPPFSRYPSSSLRWRRRDAGRTQPPLPDHQGTVPRSDIGPDRPSARNDPQSCLRTLLRREVAPARRSWAVRVTWRRRAPGVVCLGPLCLVPVRTACCRCSGCDR